jgi:CHASE2 domain-containing sensor protein
MVIVNIGSADRKGISEMIQTIAAQQPKALGVDILFDEAKTPESDSMLEAAFNVVPQIVMAYNLETANNVVKPSGLLYSKVSNKGFANFVGETGGVIRHSAPFYVSENNSFNSFAASVASIAYPEAYLQLKKRNQPTETINYSRKPANYLVVDGEAMLADSNFDASLFTNKVVLMGYISNDEYSLEDKHFTPLNSKAVGKSIPDMEGVFIHANIIQMFRDGQYINKVPAYINWGIAILLGWLHMSLFVRYFIDKHIWFHLVAKIAQVLSAILFIYIGLLCYYQWDLSIYLTPTFVAIILAVDVLYFYEAITAWLHKRFGYHSLFINTHKH